MRERACWSRCWCSSQGGCFYIISGERRYHAARAAGLREVPCIEKSVDDAETLEIALIENIQRKDLTAFEEADGLHRLATQFEYTHEDVAQKIGRARSSVTETLSLRNIPESLRKKCIENGITSKGLLLQIARQPKEDVQMFQRILQGGLTHDEHARAGRRAGPQRRGVYFHFEPQNDAFKFASNSEESRCTRRVDYHAEGNPVTTGRQCSFRVRSGLNSGVTPLTGRNRTQIELQVLTGSSICISVQPSAN